MNRRRFRTLGAVASGTRQVQKATGIDKAHAVVGGFHLAPAHALHAAHGFIEQCNAQDDRRSERCSGQRIDKRNDPPALDHGNGKARQHHNKAEDDSQRDTRLGQQVGQELCLCIGKDQPDQQKTKYAEFDGLGQRIKVADAITGTNDSR